MDNTGMGLRAIQYNGYDAIDRIFSRMSIAVEKIILKNQEYPNGNRKPGVLTQEGKERAMREISALLRGVEPELVDIIDAALDETVALAWRTKDDD